jgi:mRNA (guanine-N7-)-methyltransferase
VKKLLITSVAKKGDTLVDYACGKGGDFPKWIKANLSFIFGIDVHADNLENRIDGACARFLNYKKEFQNMPYALFVNGDSTANIRNGSAMMNDKAIEITKAVFGEGSKDSEKLGKAVARQYGKGSEGFNISSCQFAIHYFFENQTTFQNYMRNISECTKVGGYFIGTSYDGKLLFNLLKGKIQGEGVEIVEDGIKIWNIKKQYTSDNFEDDITCLGYKIDVFQESINKSFSEFLVNYDYLNRVMEDYGFKLITREEAKAIGMPEGSGLFSELFVNMQEEIKRNKTKEKDYGTALQMNAFEKKISFLNRYFVYKKIRNVNAAKVELESMEESEASVVNALVQTKTAVKEIKKIKKEVAPKIRKLDRKLTLDESTAEVENAEKKTTKKAVKSKKPIILIEEDDED